MYETDRVGRQELVPEKGFHLYWHFFMRVVYTDVYIALPHVFEFL